MGFVLLVIAVLVLFFGLINGIPKRRRRARRVRTNAEREQLARERGWTFALQQLVTLVSRLPVGR